MAVSLTVGSKTFEYSEQGASPGWGEQNTLWASAITDRVALFSGANDKTTTNFNFSASACMVSVSCLQFTGGTAAGTVRSFEVAYTANRTCGSCITAQESGTMEGVYDGADWDFGHNHVGCACVCFVITSAGQVQIYASDGTCCSDGNSGSVKFRARTIDN